MRFTRIALAVSLNLIIGSTVVPTSHRVNHNNTTPQQHTQRQPTAANGRRDAAAATATAPCGWNNSVGRWNAIATVAAAACGGNGAASMRAI